MATWTPGPIRFRRIGKPHGWVEYDFITDDADGPGTYAVARFYGENHESDARLWAQAPAMAKFIRRIANGISHREEDCFSDSVGTCTFHHRNHETEAIDEARAILRAIEEG